MNENKFSKEIYGDADGIYMSCPEVISKHLAEKLAKYKTGVELCCALGITVIQLAKKLEYVYGIDMDTERIISAKKNAQLYGVQNKTEFIQGNVLDETLLKSIQAEVAILDPEWSGGSNKKEHVADLEMTQPSMKDMIFKVKKNITHNLVLRIPNTFTFETLSILGKCEIENIIWDNRVRFKYAFFADDIVENRETDVQFTI